MRINLESKNFIELILNEKSKKDVLLILPGGGYFLTSEREAMPVVDAFRDLDMHHAIYYYREEKHLYPEVMREGEAALTMLKSHEFINDIYIMGFSAGGHYAGLLMTAYPKLIKASILLYPVITTDKSFIHHGSFNNLLGDSFDTYDLKQLSIEQRVDEKTPPVFLMHTVDDQVVGVENSLCLFNALRKVDVEVELHLYPKGRHGVSIATKEVAFIEMDPNEFSASYGYIHSWVALAKSFIRRYQ